MVSPSARVLLARGTLDEATQGARTDVGGDANFSNKGIASWLGDNWTHSRVARCTQALRELTPAGVAALAGLLLAVKARKAPEAELQNVDERQEADASSALSDDALIGE